MSDRRQDPWTGQPPPHGTEVTFAVQRTPAGLVVVFTCSTCGARLAVLVWDNPASKLPANWWRCQCGANDAAGAVVA